MNRASECDNRDWKERPRAAAAASPAKRHSRAPANGRPERLRTQRVRVLIDWIMIQGRLANLTPKQRLCDRSSTVERLSDLISAFGLEAETASPYPFHAMSRKTDGPAHSFLSSFFFSNFLPLIF